MIAVTIIVPMYNVAGYLKTCIASILDQNLVDDTFEVLMIDDESPDNSRNIAEGLSKKYSFIKVISQENRGLGGARNTGIRNSCGKYILFLDADDKLMPHALNKLIQLSDKYNLDILEFGAEKENEAGEVIASITKTTQGEVYNGVQYCNNIKYMGSACNKLYALSYLKEYKLFFLEKIYGEDFEFNTRAFYYAKRVMATDIIGASFLQSSNSITRNNDQKKKDKYLSDYVKILENLSAFSKDKLDNVNDTYFLQERLSLITINTFYFLFKNNYSYKKFKQVRKDLVQKKIFFTNYPVSDKNRELFRQVMIKNFVLFKIFQPIKNLLK
tara:strand:- start:511 stop:1494 length:984 start_codon:yes stop_codon:yes gene_type:complete